MALWLVYWLACAKSLSHVKCCVSLLGLRRQSVLAMKALQVAGLTKAVRRKRLVMKVLAPKQRGAHSFGVRLLS